MKKFLLMICAFLYIATMQAVTPSYFSGKLYAGEVLADGKGLFVATNMIGESTMLVEFKSSGRVSVELKLIPGDKVMSLLTSLAKAESIPIVRNGIYKIHNNQIIMQDIDNKEKLTWEILQNGDVLVLDADDSLGISVIATPLR